MTLAEVIYASCKADKSERRGERKPPESLAKYVPVRPRRACAQCGDLATVYNVGDICHECQRRSAVASAGMDHGEAWTSKGMAQGCKMKRTIRA
jgi:hypothetical protein